MLNPLNKKLWSEGANLKDDGIDDASVVKFLKTQFTETKGLRNYEVVMKLERHVRDFKLEQLNNEINDLSKYPIKDVVVIDKPRCQSCKSPMHVSDIYDGFDLCGGLECEAWKKELKKVRKEAKDIEYFIDKNDDLDRYFRKDYTPHDINNNTGVLKSGLLMTSDEEWYIETCKKSRDITTRLSSV